MITMHPCQAVDEIRLGFLTRKQCGWTRRQLENRRRACKRLPRIGDYANPIR
jgi:hypothetical protein